MNATNRIEWLKAEMDRLQVWFAGNTRRANPEGWDYRSNYYDALETEYLELTA